MTARTPPMTLNAPSCWNTFKGFMGYLSFFSVIARGDRHPQAENSIPENPGFVKTGSASSRKQCGRDGKAASRGRCRFALPVKFQSSAKRIPLLFSVHFSLLSGNGNSREEGREKREENKKTTILWLELPFLSGGECEIRTHGGSPHHQFSRLAP